MTILDSNKELNELIKNGFVEVKSLDDKHVYLFTLNGNQILCDGYPVGHHVNTIDKRMTMLCQDARRAYFIEEILKSIGIIIDDIESSYDVLCSSETYILFCKKSDEIYTFIEFTSEKYYDFGKSLRVVKLDLITNNLIYDRIDLNELKHYHLDSKISEFTLNEINNSWLNRKILTQNNLYDVIAEDVPKSKCGTAWNDMNKFGNFVNVLNVDKLDRNICEVEIFENEKTKIYYL